MGTAIKLTAEESKGFFIDALCNGMNQMNHYGLEWVIDENQYKSARMQFGDADSVYFESVIMKMLEMGYTISLKDLNDGGYDSTISLDDVINRVNLTPSNHIMDMMNGEDDSTTADAIIQSVFYKEVIFG